MSCVRCQLNGVRNYSTRILSCDRHQSLSTFTFLVSRLTGLSNEPKIIQFHARFNHFLFTTRYHGLNQFKSTTLNRNCSLMSAIRYTPTSSLCEGKGSKICSANRVDHSRITVTMRQDGFPLFRFEVSRDFNLGSQKC